MKTSIKMEDNEIRVSITNYDSRKRRDATIEIGGDYPDLAPNRIFARYSEEIASAINLCLIGLYADNEQPKAVISSFEAEDGNIQWGIELDGGGYLEEDFCTEEEAVLYAKDLNFNIVSTFNLGD